MDESKLYTADELARLAGLDVEEIWQRLECGELTAVAYAEGGGMTSPCWRVLPTDGVKWMRVGTRDLIEWESATGRLTAACDARGIRVQLLDVDIQALRRPRGRVTGLCQAVMAAWDAGLPVDASVSTVMAYLRKVDDTGAIKRVSDGAVTWLDDKRVEHETSKKTLANSLKGWRENYHRRPQVVT